jgi:xanthine dehydrogenase small subunit
MAGIPARAPGCEAALTGRPWSEDDGGGRRTGARQDYEPLDDLRGSAAYRRKVAANLLRRIWAEQNEPVSVLHG